MAKKGSSSGKLPRNQLVLGNCISHMASWPEGSVDLIFADPPYNIGFQYGDHYQDARPDDEYIGWTRDWVTQCARLLKPTGSFYILIGDEYAADVRLILRDLEKQDKQLMFRNWIIWHYTFGQNCRTKFNRSHAHLFYCVGSAALQYKTIKVDDPPFAFNRSEVAVPSARQLLYNDRRAKPSGKLPDDVWFLRPQEALEAESGHFDPDCDTWYESRLCGTFGERQGWHPCQLPEALLERIVRLSSNSGDMVYDPFAGSGTTLAVAARLKRAWLGSELGEDYLKQATERIEYCQRTGQSMQSTLQAKGIERGKPKKKAEPYRSDPKKDFQVGAPLFDPQA